MRAINSYFYSNIKRKDIPNIGVRYPGLVVDCTFKGKDCGESDFKYYLHPSLISCFTFQANRTNNSETTDLLVGPHNGLSLVLRSEANANFLYESLDKLQNVESVRIAIHAPGTIPYMTNKGINLEPGKSTSISLMMKEHKRLGSPYTKCQDKGTFDLDSRTYILTSDVCHDKCIVGAIQKKCNCTSTLFEDLTVSELGYCLQIDDGVSKIKFHERIVCEMDLALGDGSVNCDECAWDCSEINYDKEITFSAWPDDTKIRYFIRYHVEAHDRKYYTIPRSCADPVKSYYALLLKKANLSRVMCPNVENITNQTLPFSLITLTNTMRDSRELFAFARPDFTEAFGYVVDVPKSYYNMKTIDELNAKWVKDSFYRVNIYFRQSSVEQNSQVPNFSFADLCSSIGGILGLWMGVSVMTIIEIVSYIIKSIYCSAAKKTNVKETKVQPYSEEQ